MQINVGISKQYTSSAIHSIHHGWQGVRESPPKSSVNRPTDMRSTQPAQKTRPWFCLLSIPPCQLVQIAGRPCATTMPSVARLDPAVDNMLWIGASRKRILGSTHWSTKLLFISTLFLLQYQQQLHHIHIIILYILIIDWRKFKVKLTQLCNPTAVKILNSRRKGSGVASIVSQNCFMSVRYTGRQMNR